MKAPSLEKVALLAGGFALGTVLPQFVSGRVTGIPSDINRLLQNLRIHVMPTDGTPWYIFLGADAQSKVLEVEVKTGDWFHELLQLGVEDRGLPYDGRGHGEGTFRIWWGTSPNKEGYTGEMWFLEAWLGGAYPKNLEYQHPAGTWTNIMPYYPAIPEWAKYFEIHPDGHIM